MTDELLKEKGEISTKENLREQDVLLATGEQITIAKLSMCLSDLGYKAISLLGWQVPIITDSNYGDANIIDIKTDRILKELKEEKIVIIAGFQGVTRDNNITTLGRRRQTPRLKSKNFSKKYARVMSEYCLVQHQKWVQAQTVKQNLLLYMI